MRINARIAESQHVFSKTQLVNDIKSFLLNDIGLENDEVVITGMVVLFDDMLKQLADSQIRTLGYVVAATLLMFALLLRSLKLALIALIPNLLAAILILAFMGYANISMDMMTVTIAAICIGIGVDDAIHYLHRFKLELVSADTVSDAVIASHQTIGRAMYFTTMTVMGGFSILAFSNFVPTVYFGLLTSMAMGLALLANLLLLPSLLVALNGGRAKH
jgi:predicted RND superfamily exporter protein